MEIFSFFLDPRDPRWIERAGGTTSGGSERLDWDNFYKTLVQLYFWDALAIFAPALRAAADTSFAPVFLEQEMRKLAFTDEDGAQRVDMLIRIKLLCGEDALVICHIEIQGKGGDDLPTRMYVYKERIHLQFGIEPIGIAFIIDDRPKGENTRYISQQFGVTSLYEYLNVPILDLPDEVLLANDNRIGLVLYALKCAKKSGSDEGMKFRYLKELSRLWAQRKWAREDKRMILLALDYQMQLSDRGYRRQLADYVDELTEAAGKEERKVYVSIFEEVYTEKGMQKGMAQGIAQGMAQGRTEGRAEGRAEVARNMLRKGLSVDSVVEYTDLPRREVESLVSR